MRVDLKDIYGMSKKDRYRFLIDNKKDLIKQKKAMPVYSDVWEGSSNQLKKQTVKEIKSDVTEIRIKAVANTANWMDHDQDVLLPDCWKKSITERKHVIPHLHDHIHSVDAKIGEVVDIVANQLTYGELGLKGEGTTQALIFITDVYKSYNEKIFNQYKLGKVNQHSIGMQYVQLALAINDKEEKEEFNTWEKYYDQVINKDKADEYGFFWAVSEIKLLENSAVLFGSNEITPTLQEETKIETSIVEPNKSSLIEKPDYSTLIKNINDIKI